MNSRLKWIFLLGMVAVVLFLSHIKRKTDRTRQQEVNNVRKTLLSLRTHDITSFQVLSYMSYNNREYREFIEEQSLVTEFFQAIVDSKTYNPAHDQALAQWGLQIHVNTMTFIIGGYIPDLLPGIAVWTIRTNTGVGYFQSPLLLDWYQKYGHYWEFGDYQYEQYSKVLMYLKSFSRRNITAFKIDSVLSGTNELQEAGEIAIAQEDEMVEEFAYALEDIQFLSRRYHKGENTWRVQFRIGTTMIIMECTLPTDNSLVVIGFIDSPAGYSYFQSQQLFQWYQTYKDRWLTPAAAQPGATAAPTPP